MTIWIFRLILMHSAQNDKVRAFVFESELIPKGTALCHTEPLAKYPNDKTKMLKYDKKGRKMNKNYCIYIITNKRNGTLYIGVTNDLKRRIYEHKNKLVAGFSQRYDLTRLVYYEANGDIKAMIEREKYLKGKKRGFKIALIEKFNPQWRDLYDEI